ncbi:MAG: hypothetical protein EAZ65_08170 [Verrucomicrobia bacterium]|nr:MAG: hypothetical protein EAZ84_05945 [Verrucomicrobiota bacterium]TAE86884.1 MAG: hypothetical protein EAZ82_09540 [Verrucomicrobiota bacterium]TAF24656.1 MAG: hypothetical protein EAZ71_09765 [Verrucomicrobiota bacterium]TAF40391.1 MAG: hypothetical protein EAZ65_08170 [Verrucomicrobiota bacterium]
MSLRSLCVILLLLATAARAQLTWSLASGNESWPADKRAAIVAAMDAAVAIYNDHGYFPKTLWANYSPGVPTAQASYSGWIDFGGSIGTRVALHEISHTLGVGQVAAWNSNRSGNTWTGTFANNRVKLFNGASATLSADTQHFWPYGLNYDSEDGATNRVRHVKMVSAMRRDMGIVTDSDADGIPNDWEMFHFGNLTQGASGDADGDGVNNLAEYNADTDPAAFTTTWSGGTSSDWATASNWSPSPLASNGSFFARLNVNNAANQPLIYDAARGTTVLRPTDRGLVIGSGTSGSGSMSITGGSLSTIGAASPDVIGNSGNTGSLTLNAGSFSSDALQLGVAGQGTGTLTLNGGNASITAINFTFATGGTGTIHLNAATLTTGGIARTGSGTGTLHLNGGTLRASASSTTFLENLTNTFIKSGGVTLDTATYYISIAQALKTDSSSPGGGLTKSGTGILTLTGSNTFTGPTAVNAGILIPENAAALSASTSVAADATLALTGALSYSETTSLTLSGTGQKTTTTATPAAQRGALQSISGANTWSGAITIAVSNTRIGVQDGASLTLGGPIGESSPATSVIFRAGQNPGDDITLGASASWTGDSIVFSGSPSGGALKLGAPQVLPAASPLLLAGNSVSGRLDLNGHDQSVAGLTNSSGGSSPVGTGIVTNNGLRPATLTLSPSISRTFIGSIQDGSQPVHLVKSGAATQIFSGPQSYTGDTSISQGTLRIDHPYLADRSRISIASGAKLQLNFSGADLVATLRLGGMPMPPGTYSATSHPAFFSGSGSLLVPATFDNWMNQFPGLLDADKLSTSDPDGDGVDNLTEFAFGGHPTQPASRGRSLVQVLDTRDDSVANPELTLTVEVRVGTVLSAQGPDLVASIDGIDYRFQGSRDLNTFATPVSELVPHLGPANPSPGYTFKTIRLDSFSSPPAKGFLRATATATPP